MAEKQQKILVDQIDEQLTVIDKSYSALRHHQQTLQKQEAKLKQILHSITAKPQNSNSVTPNAWDDSLVEPFLAQMQSTEDYLFHS